MKGRWRHSRFPSPSSHPGGAAALFLNRRSVLLVPALLAALCLSLLFLLNGGLVRAQDTAIDYAEKGEGPVETYIASDPEGLGIGWDVTGTDADYFEINNQGELRFKESPDFEDPKDDTHTATLVDGDPVIEGDADNAAGNNQYVIMVRATEVRPTGDESPAQSTALRVVVTVTNEDEDGEVTLSRLVPQVGVTSSGTNGLYASLTDPDTGAGNLEQPTATWQWSTAKVSRPELENDDHWQPAGAGQTTQSTYSPVEADLDKHLRVKASYPDGEGTGKAAYVLSAYPVRAMVDSNDNNDPDFALDGDYTRELPEDTAVGANVGAPVRATDANSSDILTYVLSGTHEDSFAIDQASGQITVADRLDFEAGGDGDGEYTVTVTAYDPSNQNDSQDVIITTTNVNEKPAVAGMPEVDNHAEKNSVDDAVVYTALAEEYTPSDVDAGDEVGDLTLTLSGVDADAFKLGEITNDATGVRALTFKTAPNFEAPTDANGDNVYKVTIVVTDPKGLTGERAVNVIVTNVEEAGKVTLSSIQPQAGVALRATLVDPDGGEADMEWQWSSALTSGGAFAPIRGATSASYTPVATVKDNPATEDVNEGVEGDEGIFLQVTVTYKDAQAPDDPKTEAIEGTERELMATSANAVRKAPDRNDPPVFAATMTREVNENTAAGRNVGDPVMATDADSDDLTYTLSGGADKDSFDIVGTTGQITVGAGTDLDHEEGKRTYEVVVKAEDPFGESATVMVTITVADVDEKPMFEGEDPEDYAEKGEGPVETYIASDPEGLGIGWDVTGTDADYFEINNQGELRFKESPDFEDPKDDTHTATLVDGDPVIEGDADNAAGNNQYVIMVRATEVRPTGDESPAQSTALRVVVTVTNEDEDGEVTLSRLVPQVGVTSSGTNGLYASLTDPDTGAGNLEQPTATWQWSTAKVSRPELENDDHWQPAGAGQTTQSTYSPVEADLDKHLRVKASYPDGEGTGKAAYVLSAYPVRAMVDSNDNNDPDFALDGGYTRELPEDTAVGANVGAPVRATDANSSDILTYVLSGTHEDSFAIDQASGQITVADGLDFEAGGDGDGEYTVTVTAYDPSNQNDSQDVIITTTNVNEKPAVAGMPEVDNHAEKNSVDDAVVYTALAEEYTPSDVDAGDEVGDLTLTLSGVDADAFKLGEITNDATGVRALTFKTAPNFEAPTDANGDNVYKVTIVVTDPKGLTGERAVNVIVTNVEEAGKVTLSSMQPQAEVALRATLSDPDGGETDMRWQWSSSLTSGGAFTPIPDATSATYTPVEDDPATENVDEGDEGKFLRVTVTYNDAQSLDDPDTADTDEAEDRELMATSANAVRKAPEMNSAPEFAATMTRTVKENTGAGGNVGEPVRAMDADTGDVLTYSWSGGADMDKFDIYSGTGQITVGAGTDLDYEEGKRTYEVVVKAEDPFGESTTVMVTITVMDVDEPPVFGEAPQPLTSIRGARSVGYDENAMDVVESYEAMGTEADQAVWSLSGDDADDFRINNVGELTFATPPDYEDPADADMDNVYEVTVVATAGTATQEAVVTVTVANLDDDEGTGDDLVDRYDTNNSGTIDKDEVLSAITDYLFPTGQGAITSKEDVLRLITLYLFP